MGGTVIETESERIIKNSTAKAIVEMGQDIGMDDVTILSRLQGKLNLSLEAASDYLQKFGNRSYKWLPS
jgi:hypothetical protein